MKKKINTIELQHGVMRDLLLIIIPKRFNRAISSKGFLFFGLLENCISVPLEDKM